jgi:aminopeptidase C
MGYQDDYYIVKNSWGSDWGEDGYFKIRMSDGRGICGLNTYLFFIA